MIEDACYNDNCNDDYNHDDKNDYDDDMVLASGVARTFDWDF